MLPAQVPRPCQSQAGSRALVTGFGECTALAIEVDSRAGRRGPELPLFWLRLTRTLGTHVPPPYSGGTGGGCASAMKGWRDIIVASGWVLRLNPGERGKAALDGARWPTAAVRATPEHRVSGSILVVADVAVMEGWYCDRVTVTRRDLVCLSLLSKPLSPIVFAPGRVNPCSVEG
jgi:hypothetical protein